MKLLFSSLLILVLTFIPAIFVYYEITQQPFQSFSYGPVYWSFAGMQLINIGYFSKFIYGRKPLRLMFYLVGIFITVSSWVYMLVKIAGNYWV